ncbi:nectin-4-like [Simochromis diagramma]|uniref:nectin-4-like n=1 Tax=Simochromis diagramma TaxID=43689 RepID=UPI001A7E7172|nr:nectin-4-like [Simochromis diagramma]
MSLASVLCCFSMIWTSLSNDPDEVITVKQGEDVTLECWGFADAPIELLEWSRPELKPDYVWYCREQRSYEKYQHPCYKGRVKLRDPDMKNGDVSVILKNVTFSDAGRYECLVGTGRTRDKRSSISVRVEQTTKDTSGGGNTERENRDVGGNMEREKWRVGQIAAIVILVFVATTLILMIGVVVAVGVEQVP